MYHSSGENVLMFPHSPLAPNLHKLYFFTCSAYYKLGGAFVYDVSQDSLDVSSEKFTFELMEAVYVGLQGTTSGYICNPAVGCNVCYECCRSYLTNQFDCDACVAVRCNSRQCYPQSSCNVCSLCCKQHFQSRDKCHNCVSTSCS